MCNMNHDDLWTVLAFTGDAPCEIRAKASEFIRQADGTYTLDLYRVDVCDLAGQTVTRRYLVSRDDIGKYASLFGFDPESQLFTITSKNRPVASNSIVADVHVHVVGGREPKTLMRD